MIRAPGCGLTGIPAIFVDAVAAVCHELNPVELVWSHLKRSLASLAKGNPTQFTALVKTRLKRMQTAPASSKCIWRHCSFFYVRALSPM